MIAWTIEAAKVARSAPRVLVSTDSPEYARIARDYGAEAPFLRPAELAVDDVPSLGPALHALNWLATNEDYRPQFLVLLQATSPLRVGGDIDAAIELALARQADAVVSVSPAACHPYQARTIDPEGRLRQFVPAGVADARRQDLPEAYAPNGAIFLIRPEVLREALTWYPEGTLAYVMPAERSLDVDSPWDVKLADMILRRLGRRMEE